MTNALIEVIKYPMGVIISTEEEQYEIREGMETEWISYIHSIKLKPGDVIPRFDEFFKTVEINERYWEL